MTEQLLKKICQSPIWILITIVTIVFSINVHFENIYLNSMDAGDFGRDLYNFSLVSKGLLPYVDFNWIYGPLTPLLYGLNFKLFGVSILSAVSLWYLITFLICITLFFTVKSFSNNCLAFISVIFFIGYHGYKIQTFNHNIGILFILIAIMVLKSYLNTNNVKYLYFLGISFFLLSLTKLNMSLAIMAGFYGLLFILYIINKKSIKHIILSFILSLGLTFTSYYILLYSITIDQLKKCFPYSSEYHQTAKLSLQDIYLSADSSIISSQVIENSTTRLLYYITTLNIWYFIIPVLAMLITIYIYKKNKINEDFTFLVILIATSLLTCHEFLIANTFYSLRFWTLPIIIILCLYSISYLYSNLKNKKYFKPVFYVVSILFVITLSFKYYNIVVPDYSNTCYYPHKRAKVKITNYQWLLLASEAINYIEKNTQPGEKVLTIPYNNFYNFITNRDQPSRISEYMIMSNLTEQEEREIIANIEKNKVNLIMYSIRGSSKNEGVGKFGITHCKIIDNYIKKNYEHAQTYVSKTMQFDKNYINMQKTFLFPITFYQRKTPFINEK